MRKTTLCVLAAAAAFAASASAQNYLVVAYTQQFPNDGFGQNLNSFIGGLGYNVTLVDQAGPGALANALNQNSFDSIFIIDVGTQNYTNQADLDALDAWYGNQRAIIVDGRSYGITQGNQAVEGQLIENIATVFDRRGGGLWIGSDHAPEWVISANAYLNRLGFNSITGLTASQNLQGDMNSDYLSVPNMLDLNGLNWGGSVGRPPEGVQPNGIEMFRILWNGNTNEQMVTGNEFIPAPGPAGLLALAGLAATRRRR